MNTNQFSKRGHILAAVGAAVGIANLVLFPARVFNYGGLAFIIVFVLCTIVLGVPLMIAETALGKSDQSDAVNAYRSIGGDNWKYAGIFGIVINMFVLSFYIIVSGWALFYLYVYVFQYGEISKAVALATSEGNPAIAGIGSFFGKYVTASGKVLVFSGIFMALTIFIVANNIHKGIEWVSKKFVPLLFVLIVLLIVIIPIVSGEKLNYSNFSLDFSALFTIDASGRIGIIEAVGQSFFSLALGACTMVTYGSHLEKDVNVVSSAHYIVHIDTIVAILAAVLIIPLFLTSDTLSANPSMIFITLVDTFYSFGEPWGRIVGIAFFALFNFAIVTSTISMLEPPVNYFVTKRQGGRGKYALIFGVIIFVLSLPAIWSFNPESSAILTDFLKYGNEGDRTMGYFNFILDFFGTFCLLVGAFILSIFVRSKWSIQGLMTELTTTNYSPSAGLRRFLSISILWITPILMLLLFCGEILKLMHKLGNL